MFLSPSDYFVTVKMESPSHVEEVMGECRKKKMDFAITMF